MESTEAIMRRFWTDVSVEQVGDAYAIRLDGRAVKTPLRRELVLPNALLAEAVKAEWDAVSEVINPAAMPMTGFANAAIDRVANERATFMETIGEYAETDLFCYHAEGPDALACRQEAAWGRWLRWAQARYFLSFHLVTGIMHEAQPEATLARLKEAVAALNDWQLAAVSKLVALSGSLVAVLALVEGEATADAIWPDLIIDELWQEEQWGADEYALKNRRDREADFKDAAAFLALVG
jgi:chaperone required for assembly of F1-ATPase